MMTDLLNGYKTYIVSAVLLLQQALTFVQGGEVNGLIIGLAAYAATFRHHFSQKK